MHPKSQSVLEKRWKNDRYPLRGIPINFREFILVIATENPVEYAEHIRFLKHNQIDFRVPLSWVFPIENSKNILRDQQYIDLENRVANLTPVF